MSIVVLCLVIAACVVLAVALFWFVRDRTASERFLTDTTRGSAIIGVVGGGFAVILAFVTLIALQNYESASSGGEAEAVAVIELWRTARFVPPADRVATQGALACYGRAVTEVEWPAMRDGHRAPLVDEWVLRIGDSLGTQRVASLRSQSVLDHELATGGKRSEGRRERLAAATPFIPTPVWFVLVLGGLVTIAFVTLFKDKSEPFGVQAALIGAVTIMTISGLALIWFLDHPYRNEAGSLQPTEMRRTLAIMASEGTTRPPCDAHGQPG
jgi:hypothetical protein